MNRYTLLHSTPDLIVNRFDHPPHEVHSDPEREVASRWAVAFVQSGSFDIAVNRTRQTLSRGSVFVTHPGLEFQCLHADACPTDVCVSVAFEASAVSGLEHAWERAGWSARVSATPKLAYVHRRMARAVRANDPFEMERWALATLPALQADTQQGATRGPYAVRRSDVDAVVAVCRAIEADPTSRRSIAQRASDVGLPGTRLTYNFRRYLGVSPHQYVMRYRLGVAAELLSSGHSVSETCYRSGFENLSHFCRTFQRTYGVRASAWDTLPLRERQRKVQDMTGRRI
jgi:AraC-like DNA-binding protein